MNNDADTIRSFLLGLLEYFSRTVSSPSGKVDELNETRSQANSLSEPMSTSADDSVGALPASTESEMSLSTSRNEFSVEMPPLSELGDMPAVQDHFQTVLKNRLQVTIEDNPPLFPWESSLYEYPAIESQPVNTAPWLTQLRSLQLPTQLPEQVMSSLLKQCQALLTESLQSGRELVKATESLFLDQSQVMEQVAGLVLASGTVRYGKPEGQQTADNIRSAFPDGYEGATTEQQITLTMLAAKDILDALKVKLTPQCPEITREWLTTDGTITLNASYQAGSANQILLSVVLPRPGEVSIPSTGQTVIRTKPGTLELFLPNPTPGETYPVEVYFSDLDAVPLTFAIRWQ